MLILHIEMESIENISERAHALLAKFYGYRSFRPGQLKAIEAICEGRDVVVVMPTGGGKSICYQLPALLADTGVAIVVSPLIALMQDQTQALVANGIPAAAIHSNQSEAENAEIMRAASAGRIKLLYVSPERLMTLLDSWSNARISLVAIDEAHCISQWGHDFRPDYTALGKIRQICPDVPIMALTATADEHTRADIIFQLGLSDPWCWLGSFDRPNISLSVIPNPGIDSRVRTIISLVRKYPQDSGISYCLSRAGAEKMHAHLTAKGIRSVCYHAGMTPEARTRSLQAFLKGSASVCCATVAFGMGIDKSNIRWVVHNNMPANIESYYQEIGRAGRDGMPAEAILFFSLADMITLRKFADESGRVAVNNEKLERMLEYAQARLCRRRILLSYFGEERSHDCGNCDVCRRPPERFDGTVVAQKAMSALLRAPGSAIGAGTLSAILRGIRRSDIVREGLHNIKTFGAGADIDATHWASYITQMVQLGVLSIDYTQGNRLMPTAFGRRVLAGEKLILARYQPPEAPAKRKRGKAEPTPTLNPVEQLFEQLKTVRTDVARTENLPPYIIFSDATLMDMATKRPTTIDEFMQVNGVGEKKAVRYGKRFIAAVRKFEGLATGSAAGTSLKETLILFNAGVPLGEIASIKNIKLSTVYSHIAALIDNDMITTYGTFLSRKQYETIKAAFASNPETAYSILADEGFDDGLIAVAKAVERAAARRNNTQ